MNNSTLSLDCWKRNFGDSNKGTCYCCGNYTIFFDDTIHTVLIKTETWFEITNANNLVIVCGYCKSNIGDISLNEYNLNEYNLNNKVVIPAHLLQSKREILINALSFYTLDTKEKLILNENILFNIIKDYYYKMKDKIKFRDNLKIIKRYITMLYQ